MRPRISTRGSVRPSIGPSVRNAFVSNTRKHVISASEVEGMTRGERRREEGWGGGEGVMRGRGRGDEGAGKGVTRRKGRMSRIWRLATKLVFWQLVLYSFASFRFFFFFSVFSSVIQSFLLKPRLHGIMKWNKKFIFLSFFLSLSPSLCCLFDSLIRIHFIHSFPSFFHFFSYFLFPRCHVPRSFTQAALMHEP